MRTLRVVSVLAMVALAVAPAVSAESWKMSNGQVVEGTLRGVHGEYVLITNRTRFGVFRISDFPDDELTRMADHLIAHPQPATGPWNQAGSRVAKDLQGRLQILSDGALKAFDPGERPLPDYFLAYFSAHWCGPCRRFTPRLVERYHALKRAAPDRFELVFISNDTSARDQEKYVREAGMPWPFVRYRALGSVRSLEQWEGNGIPCLIVVDREGNLIFHSYNGDEYLGPDDVLTRFETLLAGTSGRHTPPHDKVHRLAVLMHTRSKPADGPPRAYWVDLDLDLFPALRGKKVMVGLEIHADGRVAAVRPDEQMSDLTAMRFRDAAMTWQFLPAIRDGVPVAENTLQPLQLGTSP